MRTISIVVCMAMLCTTEIATKCAFAQTRKVRLDLRFIGKDEKPVSRMRVDVGGRGWVMKYTDNEGRVSVEMEETRMISVVVRSGEFAGQRFSLWGRDDHRVAIKAAPSVAAARAYSEMATKEIEEARALLDALEGFTGEIVDGLIDAQGSGWQSQRAEVERTISQLTAHRPSDSADTREHKTELRRDLFEALNRLMQVSQRWRLGVTVRYTEQGAVVQHVSANSPAGRAGLRRNDVISAVDGQPVGRLDWGEVTLTQQFRQSLGGQVELTVGTVETGVRLIGVRLERDD